MTFNKLTRGEKAYLMNEVIEALNVETAYYSDWLEIWPDGASLEDAKDEFNYADDDTAEDKKFKDELWDSLNRKFRIRVEMFGCKDGYSIQKEDIDGLRIPCVKNAEFEEEERGGGFYFFWNDESQHKEATAKIIRARYVLFEFGYPLTLVEKSGETGVSFYVDHEEWRAKKAADFIKESVGWLKEQDCGCCTIRLTKNSQLAVGWENGYDPKDETVIHSKSQPEWAIVVGIKALEGDDMKTDFEYLTTPYVGAGDDEGEVFTNLETTLSPRDDLKGTFAYLFDQYKELMKKYKIYPDGKCLPR